MEKKRTVSIRLSIAIYKKLVKLSKREGISPTGTAQNIVVAELNNVDRLAEVSEKLDRLLNCGVKADLQEQNKTSDNT